MVNTNRKFNEVKDLSTSSILNQTNDLDTINIRSINYKLAQKYLYYAKLFNQINGNDLFGSTQVKQVADKDGISIEYSKGRLIVNNDIDKLQFLQNYRAVIAETIGTTSTKIFKGRRTLTFMTSCLDAVNKKYELGDEAKYMQLYVSKKNNNIQNLTYEDAWTPYIMCQDWIDEVGESSVSYINLVSETGINSDTSREVGYISNLIYGWMQDHEVKYHSSVDTFDGNLYLDRADDDKFIDAFNKLNSMTQLNYCFYEIFKPMGSSAEKYIKVKVYTNGEVDIQGVVGLSDCTKADWEYGSMDYLRSLNTGNQRYRLDITIPWNDTNSVLYWKPDEKEEIEVDNSNQITSTADDETPTTYYRYYKQYETERFLRWFGTNYIPFIDPDDISQITVCSIPVLSNDVQSNSFYADATNILNNPDYTKATIDTSTSLSLLSLAKKSSIELVTTSEKQYLEFVVSGHQQTSNISFHIHGQTFATIQEANHYANTYNLFNQLYLDLNKAIMFFEMTRMMHTVADSKWIAYQKEINSGTKTAPDGWTKLDTDGEYIPSIWLNIRTLLEQLVWTPKQINLLRMRQLDIETIISKFEIERQKRYDYLYNNTEEEARPSDNGIEIYDENLYGFIHPYVMGMTDTAAKAAQKCYYKLNMTDDIKSVIKTTLENLIQEKMMVTYVTSVSELRNRITTLNNLITRLPDTTRQNRVASRHIFLDWKNYVDKSLEYLVDQKLLWKADEPSSGVGTDGLTHTYYEYYTDSNKTTPFIDYSYCIDSDGKVIHDRWDYWNIYDFTVDTTTT